MFPEVQSSFTSSAAMLSSRTEPDVDRASTDSALTLPHLTEPDVDFSFIIFAVMFSAFTEPDVDFKETLPVEKIESHLTDPDVLSRLMLPA